MKGKKIAVSRYGASPISKPALSCANGAWIRIKDVQIMQIGNSSARAAALASGEWDGAIVTPRSFRWRAKLVSM